MNLLKKICLGAFLVLNISQLINAENVILDPLNKSDDCCCEPSSCCRSGEFYLRGDVLYWMPRATGMEVNFGTTSITETSSDCIQELHAKETNIDPRFRWDAGYRAGVGYESNCWGAGVLWTHFNGDGKRDNHERDNIANSGKARIKLDQIDAVLAYNSHVSDSFEFKPFIGVRGTRIREHLTALLLTDIILLPSESPIETRIYNDRQKYWGIGPVFGLQADWEMGCGFGVYGTVAASVLYGDYEIHLDDSDTFTEPVSKEIFTNNKRHMHAFDYNVDLALGISWKTTFCNNFELDMKLGFEHHQYFNVNRLCVGRGDITFTGGVFSLGLGF